MVKYYYNEFRYTIKMYISFFKNIWMFRKPLCEFKWWDSYSLLYFMKIGINNIANGIETKGSEVDETRFVKIVKMRRAIQILSNQLSDFAYIELAEKECGEIFHEEFKFVPVPDNSELFRMEDSISEEKSKHNSKVLEYSCKLEDNEWNELFEILKDTNNGLKSWWD
jgi:hypothetical protein